MPATLAGRLLRTQLTVIAAIYLLLVGLSLPGMWFLVRRSQDAELKHVARAIAQGIAQEMHDEKTDFDESAREFLRETHLPEMAVQVVGTDSSIIAASDASQAQLKPAILEPLHYGCESGSRERADGDSEAWRFCSLSGHAGSWIRVGELDRTRHHELREITLLLLLLVTLSAALGVVLTRRSIRVQLAPLERLRTAATELESKQSLRLDTAPPTQELVALEAALNGLLAQLAAALEVERSFAHQASHELRTPLTGLRLRLEQLSSKQQAGNDLRSTIEACLRDVDALGHLIDALLLLARTEIREQPNELVNASDLVREVVAAQESIDGPEATRIDVDAPDEALIDGSEELLRRALSNLVENARKYAGQSAHIIVRVAEVDTGVEVVVEDDGPGMPSAVRGRAFERYFRGDAAKKTVGTGLGLAVVAAVVRLHRGTVELTDSTRGGLAVRLRLPRHDPMQGHE